MNQDVRDVVAEYVCGAVGDACQLRAACRDYRRAVDARVRRLVAADQPWVLPCTNDGHDDRDTPLELTCGDDDDDKLETLRLAFAGDRGPRVVRLGVVAFALDGAKDALRDAPDGCGSRPVAVFDSRRTTALGVPIELAFDREALALRGPHGCVVDLNTHLDLLVPKDVPWAALTSFAADHVLPLRTLKFHHRAPPSSACAVIAACTQTLTTLNVALEGEHGHDDWPSVLSQCRSLRRCELTVAMDVPVPAAAAVIGALQQLELVELYADVPSTVKAELFKLVNERSSITRASLLIADDPFTPVGGCVLPAERARFREFGHAKHEQWAEGFTSLERIALEAPQVPTASTAASGNVRFLSLAAWANGFSNGSLPLAEVFPSLEALSITTHRRVASLDCDAVTFPPSLTSLSIDGPSVKKAFRVSDFLNRALGANAPRALGKLRFGCGIDDARPLLQLRGTLVELEITGLVPEGTGAIVGQLSALRHLDAPMLARENVPQDDDATFLLSGELRSLRTLRIASLWRTTLAAVAARCPKLHRVELPQEPSAPKAYEARYWRGNDDPPWARGTWWSFERVSFGP